jgi:hypothetical protein
LKINLLSGVMLAAFWTLPAFAHQDPSPRPSGVVIHLFGPNSVTSGMLPTVSEPHATAQAGGGSKSAPAGDTGYVTPNMHDILHQMFITGDPNQKPGAGLAKGRTGPGH